MEEGERGRRIVGKGKGEWEEKKMENVKRGWIRE